jgi:hypothetical protein
MAGPLDPRSVMEARTGEIDLQVISAPSSAALLAVLQLFQDM